MKWNITGNVIVPVNKNDLAFYSILQLASLIKNKKISSVQLTRFFIERLKKFGDTLQCVISVTEDIAIQQGLQADKEIAGGKYRGPLHGIPYRLKNLFAVKGTMTTWGATPCKNQVIDEYLFCLQTIETGRPTSITLLGKLYDEATLLAVAKAFQDATDFNKQHPELFK